MDWFWNWLAGKIYDHTDWSIADELIKKAETLQGKLDAELHSNLAAFANLQEEVFLLRDELAAYGKYLGLEFDQDIGTGKVTAEPSEEQTTSLREAADKAREKCGRLRIEGLAGQLITTIVAVEEHREKRRKRRSANSQLP